MSAGVAGFRVTPDLMPYSLIDWSVLCRCGQVSWWTIIWSAPALTKSSIYFSGSTIIKWTSRNMLVIGLIAATTPGPKLILGTKRPSITSIWIPWTPASCASTTASPNFVKSADNIEGSIFTILYAHALCIFSFLISYTIRGSNYYFGCGSQKQSKLCYSRFLA